MPERSKTRPRDPNELHVLAFCGFKILGPAARSAVPQLIASLDDDDADVRAGSAYALSLIGPPGVAALPALEKRLTVFTQSNAWTNDWQDEADSVLHCVGEMGPQAR